MSEPTRQDGQSKRFAFLREAPTLVIAAFLVALLVKSLLFQAFVIPSESMVPTLVPGDRVIVSRAEYHLRDVHRGDVIVFRNPHPEDRPRRSTIGVFLHWLAGGLGSSQGDEEDLIKRVVGLPGETIEAHGGAVYVDGRRLEEPYLTQQTGDFGPVKVPEGAVFVMGDNRSNSGDSRYGLGPIPFEDIIGEAVVIAWPPSRWGGLG